MRLRWYILAALAAAMATIVVWAWPDGPMWRSGPNAGRLQDFSADGQILITSFIPNLTPQGRPDPIVWRWNVETGELLSRVVFPCKDRKKYKAVSASDDGRLVLVGEGESWQARGTSRMATGIFMTGSPVSASLDPFPGSSPLGLLRHSRQTGAGSMATSTTKLGTPGSVKGFTPRHREGSCFLLRIKME